MIYVIQNRLGEINWANLQPGDEVHVPYRTTPYYEKIALFNQATKDKPLIIKGLPGPNGEKPHICGTNATTDPQFRIGYEPIENYGLITIRSLAGQPTTGRASNIIFDGLEVSGATNEQPQSTFTAADGTTKTWASGAMGFYTFACDGLTIKNCKIHNNGQGIFTADSDGKEVRDLLVEGNEIYNNGVTGSDRSHNTYCQAAGATYRNNRYGPLRVGAGGGGLKDRSADVLIEGNYIEGGSRFIDLSAAQSDSTLRMSTPNANRSIVRNNVLDIRQGDAVSCIYCEPGRGPIPTEVFVINNTFSIIRDQSETYKVRMFQEGWVDGIKIAMAGNLISVMPKTPGASHVELRLYDEYCGGELTLTGKNRIYHQHAGEGNVWSPSQGTVVNKENMEIISGVQAGFVDSINKNFNLVDGSPATGFGATNFTVPTPPSPVNTSPTVSMIPNQTIVENSVVGPLTFTVNDAETVSGLLVVTAQSNNSSLVPTGAIMLGGSGANRTITITPVSGLIGTAVVTIIVKDAGNLTTTTSFVVTVNAAPNAAPTISIIPNQSGVSGAVIGPVPFIVDDSQTPDESLTLSAQSNNATLIPVSNIVFGGSGQNRTVTVTPVAGQVGSATITVSVADSGNMVAATAFIVTVTASSVKTWKTVHSVTKTTGDLKTETRLYRFV